MNRRNKGLVSRARLVAASFVVAVVGLTCALAFAQEPEPAAKPAPDRPAAAKPAAPKPAAPKPAAAKPAAGPPAVITPADLPAARPTDPAAARRAPAAAAAAPVEPAAHAPAAAPDESAPEETAPAETAPAEHAPAEHAPAEHAPAEHAPAAAHGSDHGEAAGMPAGEHGSETAGHGEHAAGGHHGPEAINWTDIWDKRKPAVLALVINFGVLMALYYMLGKKPVTDALKQRRVTIGKDIDEAQKLLSEAKERAKKYQGDLKNVDADASTAKGALVTAAKGEVERQLEEAKERAERMKRDADRLVQQERKQLQLDLLVETVELSVAEASQILEKAVTPEDHARLAQDLLAELSRHPGAKASAPTAGGAS